MSGCEVDLPVEVLRMYVTSKQVVYPAYAAGTVVDGPSDFWALATFGLDQCSAPVLSCVDLGMDAGLRMDGRTEFDATADEVTGGCLRAGGWGCRSCWPPERGGSKRHDEVVDGLLEIYWFRSCHRVATLPMRKLN